MRDKQIRADMILRQLSKRHVGRLKTPNDIFLTNVKNGRSWDNGNLLIMDALAIRKSWKKPCFTGYEVKVDRGDFLRDQKWPGYLQYCHEFYFACPMGLIRPEELPNEVGLIYYNPEKDCISTKRKALYRPVEISWELLMYLVMTRINGDSQHPFFSSRREYFEALVKDKAERKKLGIYVAREVGGYIKELQDEKRKIESELNWARPKIENYNAISKVLLKHGISLYRDSNEIAEVLDKALTGSLNPAIVKKIEELTDLANRLQQMVSTANKPGGTE
ncbi:MAG: MmcB family DNA repair protein [Thermoanaerobacter sp.]|nr:MmcB family DNA repair protein [Thermoanaerobacter sp.]